ncbi:MAG: 30S ribosomal protein S2 [Candidatus Sumerlaeia bacterium]|nr:30S ribosomal protein S2 [Candidatus Sumerlaeia bacterium]
MTSITMKQLLEAGVHFGHQSRRWNPKMKPYIYTERNGIYIIDLKKTLRLLRDAMKFVEDSAANGANVLIVGTKKQAKDIVKDAAEECGVNYINNRWLGGLMTNFNTVRKSVLRLIELEQMFENGTINQYVKKEQAMMAKEMAFLKKNLEGIKTMERLPDILFIIDPVKEHLAVKEARTLGIPIVGVVDTNCNPDDADWVIPANDDAIRSIRLMCDAVVEAVRNGRLGATESELSEVGLGYQDVQGNGEPVALSAEELEARFGASEELPQ